MKGYVRLWLLVAVGLQGCMLRPEASSKFDSLDAIVQEILTRPGYEKASAVFAVCKDGKLVHQKGFGPEAKDNPNIRMRMASVSKVFTLAAINELERTGKLKLNEPFWRFIGGLPLPEVKEGMSAAERANIEVQRRRIQKITIRDLVEHKGGWDIKRDPAFLMPRIASDSGMTKDTAPSPRQIIEWVLKKPDVTDREPGEKGVYSNFGFLILGRVIEKAAGMSYIQYLKKLMPELTSLDLAFSEKQLMDEVKYVRTDRELRGKPEGWGYFVESMDSHGGLLISAPDLCKFAERFKPDGSPFKEHEKYPQDFSWNGSIPTTLTTLIWLQSGATMAVLVNTRSDTTFSKELGNLYNGLRGAILKIFPA